MVDNGKAEFITPPQLARRWGVSPDKVLALLKSGQLKGCNLAIDPTGRARWRIPLCEIKRFEEARSSKPPVSKTRRRRRRTPATTGKEYF